MKYPTSCLFTHTRCFPLTYWSLPPPGTDTPGPHWKKYVFFFLFVLSLFSSGLQHGTDNWRYRIFYFLNQHCHWRKIKLPAPVPGLNTGNWYTKDIWVLAWMFRCIVLKSNSHCHELTTQRYTFLTLHKRIKIVVYLVYRYFCKHRDVLPVIDAMTEIFNLHLLSKSYCLHL